MASRHGDEASVIAMRQRGFRVCVRFVPESSDQGAPVDLTPWKNKAICRGLAKALFRTRTGDPFLTMEVLYQLS